MTERSTAQIRELLDSLYRVDSFTDVASGVPSRRENVAGRRADFAGESGSLIRNRDQIAEGVSLLQKALKSGRFGAYTLQAAIAAVHAEAESVDATDWRQIVALYDRLARIQPSPVVELNRAVAIAMRDGPEAGLALIDALLAHGELANYHLAHSEADLGLWVTLTMRRAHVVPNLTSAQRRLKLF